MATREWLRARDCHVADPPGHLRPWFAVTSLPVTAHDIWCRGAPDGPWRFQLMLHKSAADGSDVRWVSRRDPLIRLPLGRIGWRDANGFPYLDQAIQLFYTSRRLRPKDERDLVAASPLLSDEQRAWLAAAIRRVAGPGHPWLWRLDPRGPDDQPWR